MDTIHILIGVIINFVTPSIDNALEFTLKLCSKSMLFSPKNHIKILKQ